jgi:hypothetical protein
LSATRDATLACARGKGILSSVAVLARVIFQDARTSLQPAILVDLRPFRRYPLHTRDGTDDE